MKLKNYQEDLVLNMIDIVLADRRDVERSDWFIHDVAAYALNRVPARYVMTERGFTRMVSEHWAAEEPDRGLSSMVELMLIINKAIDVVSSRRKHGTNGAPVKEPAGPELISDTGKLVFWHNFPQIIGKIVDADSKQPVYDASIELSINGETAEPAEPSWANPYHTNRATGGFFSFWPRSAQSAADEEQFKMHFKISHSEYQRSTITRSVATRGSFQLFDFIHSDGIYNVGTCLLNPKE